MKNSKQPRFFSVLILTGILFLGSGPPLMNTVVAATGSPQSYSETVKSEERLITQHPDDQERANQLPPQLAYGVRQDLSRQVGIPAEKLKITDYTRKTWPDGCLGIPRPNELCTQALVQGWRIILSDGRSDWVYRTDRQGRVLRLENQAA